MRSGWLLDDLGNLSKVYASLNKGYCVGCPDILS